MHMFQYIPCPLLLLWFPAWSELPLLERLKWLEFRMGLEGSTFISKNIVIKIK